MIDTSLLNPLNKNAIVIRHSDRDHMQPNQIYQPLNEVGRQNACILGEKLRGFKKYAFFSSPVDRCIETNECIMKGIFQDDTRRQISVSNVLGEPGPYVVVRKQNALKHSAATPLSKKK
jgi:broad specificity phosphatase PhoE